MTALSAASHSVQRQRWSGRSRARVAGALSLTVFARVSGAAAGMHVTHTAFRVPPPLRLHSQQKQDFFLWLMSSQVEIIWNHYLEIIYFWHHVMIA